VSGDHSPPVRATTTHDHLLTTHDHALTTVPEMDTTPVTTAESELPQQGLARSLLQQWRAMEAAELPAGSVAATPHHPASRGRSATGGRLALDARRSQSMSRVESTQRAREYRGAQNVRSVMVSREVELDCDERGPPRGGSAEDEMPPPELMRDRLAMFREMQAESVAQTHYQPTTRRVRIHFCLVYMYFLYFQLGYVKGN